ncbi:hypothetical protein AYX13_04623 [Cryptococcus neoformans]|nr:hypothetical protein AYX13_04623 [Cryptococcus neoformans var. grubii]
MASTARAKSVRNILMELRKVCQHPYLSAPELEIFDLPLEEQHRQLVNASGKLLFLKLLLPKLIARGHRILLFSQFKMALDRIQDFLYGENVKHLRLDGDTQQAQRQKYMDQFNAPNSDYHIFLLTTRAGGVGINLASADTIILHDPDFNPHQDQQAIARAYRYGQKKKVLVFKLMIKGSVEETIINKGKRKMVLDHLVVQQMGKETEENDFEDLFLKGAEGIYSGQGGINIPDINYNSKNVDELIDRVEADAEAEAKAMAERERQTENGVATQIKSKQGAQFQFSRIWEADKNEMIHDEVQETMKDDEEEENVDWEQLMVTIQAERQLRLQQEKEESRTRRKLKSKKGVYKVDDDFEVNEKKRRKNKGKSKEGELSSSDAEYMDGGLSDDGSATDMPDIDLETLQDDLSIDPMFAKSSGGIKRKRSKKTLDNVFNQSTAPHVYSQSSVSHVSASETPSGSLTTYSAQPGLSLIEPRQINTAQYSSLSKAGTPGSMASVNAPEEANNIFSSSKKSKPVDSTQARQTYPPMHSIRPPMEIIAAQNILQWLFLIIREFSWNHHIGHWATLGLRKIPTEKKKRLYYIIAADVDGYLHRLRQAPYFLEREQREAVDRLLDSGWPIIPDAPASIAVPKKAAVPIDPPFPVSGSGHRESALASMPPASPKYVSEISAILPGATAPEVPENNGNTGGTSKSLSNSVTSQGTVFMPPAPPKYVSETSAILPGVTPPEIPEKNGNTGGAAKPLLNTVTSQDTVSLPDVRVPGAAVLSSSFKEKEHNQNKSDTTNAGSHSIPLTPQISEQTSHSPVQMSITVVSTPSLSTEVAPVETSQFAYISNGSPSVSCQPGHVTPKHSTDSSPLEMKFQTNGVCNIRESSEAASASEPAPMARTSEPALVQSSVKSPSGLPSQLSSSQAIKGTRPSSSRQSSEIIVAGGSAEPGRCEYCLEDGHRLQDCQRMYNVETLEKAFLAIKQSNLSEEQKRKDLETLDRLKSLMITAGKLQKDYHFPESSSVAVKNRSPSSNACHSSAPEPGAQGQLTLDTNTSKKGKHDIPASESALHIFAQSLLLTPPQMASVVPQVCPFCEENCGRPLRACIQATGDRKSLKRKIRKLKEKIDELTKVPGEPETDKQQMERTVLRKMQSSLYDCYKKWPKERPSDL